MALAQEGADVAINYRSRADEAQAVANAVEAAGRRALLAPADVSDRDAMEPLFRQVVQHFGHLDIAVANASIRPEMVDPSLAMVMKISPGAPSSYMPTVM